jgi:DNA-binding FadR family transcriptional regulator
MSTAKKPAPKRSAAENPSSLFAPVVRGPAYTLVSSAIEAKIMRRELGEGDVLPAEGELAQQFQVHRSTVREALRRLESSGLVTRPPGAKRMVVSRPHVEKVALGMRQVMLMHDVTFVEVWEAMMVIEPQVASLAADRRSAAQLVELEQLARSFTEESNDEEAVKIVSRFFETLGDCAGNRVLMMAKRPLAQVLAPSLARMMGRVPQAKRRIVEAQRRIVAALHERDRDDALRWMTKHVRDFKRGYELAKISADERISSD